MQTLSIPQGEYRLSRYPKNNKDQLRAWDAADEYLLNNLSESLENKKYNILIINDSFGALTTALSNHNITVWSDSFLSQEGIKSNIADNNLELDNITVKNSLETPQNNFDIVLIKIPKSNAFLEDQLIRLKPILSTSTKVISSAMAKSIHTSTLSLFEKYIGPTKTSLAKKKARLIFTQNDERV